LTTNLGIQFTQPVLRSWELVARADWYFQDEFPRPIRGNLVDVTSIHLLDLQLGLKNETWGVRAFAKNVLDERYATGVADFGAFLAREVNSPRTYGVELSYRF
jgi:outer membrane receptor protein involved in Fe transport